MATAYGLPNQVPVANVSSLAILTANYPPARYIGSVAIAAGAEYSSDGSSWNAMGGGGSFASLTGVPTDNAALSSAWDNLPGMLYYAPDLSIVYCTINDSQTAVALSTYQVNMESIVSQLNATSDGCLVMGFPFGTGTNTNATNVDYDSRAQMLRNLARSYNWSFVDVRDAVGYSWGRANAQSLAYDNSHPNLAGHNLIGAQLYNFLSSIGL